MDGDANRRREHRKVGQREDLSRLLLHLLLLRRVPVLAHAPDERYGVADYRFREGILSTVLQGFDPAAPHARDGLVGRDDHLLQAELADYGSKGNDQLDSGTV